MPAPTMTIETAWILQPSGRQSPVVALIGPPGPMGPSTEAAALSAAEAAASALDAQASATAAAASEAGVAADASAAASSAGSAFGSAATATTKAGEASDSAAAAALSAATATTKAGEALDSANSASASEVIATAKAAEATTKAGEASDSAATATDKAALATSKANDSLSHSEVSAAWAEGTIPGGAGTKSAKEWAASAEAAEALAEHHSLVAAAWANGIYPTTAAGLAATASGELFLVKGAEAGPVFTSLYLNSAGVAVDQSVRLPSMACLPTFVEMHGAKGDGVTIDSDAILAAMAAAGPYGRIVFQPNKTYIYDTQFTLLAGQKVDLNGATLKRAPQAKTTLTAAFSAIGNPAAQTIQVTSAADFRVGSYITICKPTSQGDDTENRFRTDTQNHKIISKTSNTLTVQGNFQYAYAIGDEVVTCFIGFFSTAPFVQIFGGTIDGATTKHDAAASGSTANGYQVRGRRWETMSEFRLAGDYTHIHHLHFKDCPSDAFLLGGKNSKFSEITGENIGGNLSHISGGMPVHGVDCYVDGANRVWIEHDGRPAVAAYGTVGHENGAYSWSQSCQRGTLTRCTAKNARSVFAPPYSPGNDLATIRGCIGIDCQMPFYTLTYDTRAFGLLIKDCEFTNCGTGQISRGFDDTPEANADVHLAIVDCRFFETNMNIKGAHKLEMRGGFFRFNNPSGGATAIVLNDVTNVEIDTKIDGALNGVYLSGLCREVDLTIRTHRLGGYAISAQYVDAGSRGIRIKRGRFVYDAVVKRDALADWNTPTNVAAIYACDNLLVEGASAYMAVGACFVDQNGKSGVRVRRNAIETNPTGTVRPVIVRGGAGNIVKGNEITVAIRDDTAGAGVTIADNDTISWVA